MVGQGLASVNGRIAEESQDPRPVLEGWGRQVPLPMADGGLIDGELGRQLPLEETRLGSFPSDVVPDRLKLVGIPGRKRSWHPEGDMAKRQRRSEGIFI